MSTKMIDALRFVQGAVAAKDYVPELTHFRITAGHIMGFNGRMALCSPIDVDIEACPKAATFIKALGSCGDKVSLHMTGNGRLAVRSEGFRVFIECLPDYAFDFYPVGQPYGLPAGFLDIVERLAPFMGEDASRPWSMALHLEGGAAYATNNIVAVECWLGGELPPVTIPHFAIRELLRIGVDPISVQTDGNSLTFWYGQGKWLRTQLIQDGWPLAQFRGIFEKAVPGSCTNKADPLLFEALERLKPFMEGKAGRVLLLGDKVTTSAADEDGATIDVEGLPEERAFNRTMLALVGTVATHYNLEAEPAYFMGENMRGVIMGMRA